MMTPYVKSYNVYNMVYVPCWVVWGWLQVKSVQADGVVHAARDEM